MNDQQSSLRKNLTARLAIFRNRNFGYLTISAVVASVGDAFTFVAFPWLVIQLSDNAVVLGAIVATEAVPRAAFILVGGAFVDRFSPRTVIILTRIFYLTSVLAICALIFTGTIQLWMVFVNAALVGVVSAFGIPALNAFLPQIVQHEELPLANSVVVGLSVLGFLVGPAAAGLLIVWFSGGDAATTELSSLGYIFAVNAVAIFIATIAVVLIRLEPGAAVAEEDEESIIDSISNGLRFVWLDRGLFLFILYFAVQTFVIVGMIFVGFPLFANEQLDRGAASFGLLLSSLGAGMLVGIVIAGVTPSPRPQHFGTILFALGVGASLFYVALGYAQTTIHAMIIVGLAAPASGYGEIIMITWIQQRVPQEMLGRVMSVFMFSLVGIAPLSGIIAGYVVEASNVSNLISGCGVFMALIALGCLLHPRMRAIGLPSDTGSENS